MIGIQKPTVKRNKIIFFFRFQMFSNFLRATSSCLETCMPNVSFKLILANSINHLWSYLHLSKLKTPEP